MSRVVSATTDDVVERVADAVATVHDPCGLINGARWTLDQLGMIDRIEHTGEGRIHVRLLLDDPTCLYLADIFHDLKAAATAVDGVDEVEFSLRTDTVWTDERASDEVRAVIRRQRASRLQQLSIRRPQRS